MQPAPKATLTAIVAVLLLAGCASPTPTATAGGPGPTTHSSPFPTPATPSSNPTTTPPSTLPPGTTCPPTCPPPPHAADMRIDVDAVGPMTVDVPFPHLDRCLSPEDWRAGIEIGQALRSQTSAGNLTVVEGDRGWVFRLTGSGNLSASAHVDLEAKPKCQTFAYDPWSISPDPADGTLDVRASGPARVTVHASHSADDAWCTFSSTFQGDADGWTNLKGSTGEVCA